MFYFQSLLGVFIQGLSLFCEPWNLVLWHSFNIRNALVWSLGDVVEPMPVWDYWDQLCSTWCWRSAIYYGWLCGFIFDFTIQIYFSCLDILMFISQETTASQNESKYFGWGNNNVFSVRLLYPEKFIEDLYIDDCTWISFVGFLSQRL